MFEKHSQLVVDAIKNCEITENFSSLSSQDGFEKVVTLLHKAKENSGIAYILGNGGSAGIASHFCIDLMNVLKIPASTLYDSNVMSCFSNDFGYEKVFSKPLDLLLRPNDLVIAISSSGNSQNILNGVKIAKDREIPIITLSGFNQTNPLRQTGNLNFWIKSHSYGIVEMAHMCMLHTIVDLWSTYSSSHQNKTLVGCFAHS